MLIPSNVMLSVVFFFKQKTAYEMRISDWSSDVCSSDLNAPRECHPRQELRSQTTVNMVPVLHLLGLPLTAGVPEVLEAIKAQQRQIGRASCRERVCQYV